MPHGHVVIFQIAGQSARLSENRTGHEDGVRHLDMRRHRSERFAVLVEREIGGGLGECDQLRFGCFVFGPLSQFAEDQMPGEVAAAGLVADRSLIPGDVRFNDSLGVSQMRRIVGQFAQPNAADHRDGRNVLH